MYIETACFTFMLTKVTCYAAIDVADDSRAIQQEVITRSSPGALVPATIHLGSRDDRGAGPSRLDSKYAVSTHNVHNMNNISPTIDRLNVML